MGGPPRYDQVDIQPSSKLAKFPASSSVDDEAESESDASLDQMDTASTGASGSENRLYLRLALYAGGNILTLLLVLALWTVWSLLSTFRNPMIWALLCSTALQDIKEDLVVFFRRKLADDRCACSIMRCAVLYCPVLSCNVGTKLHNDYLQVVRWPSIPAFLQERSPDMPFPGLVAIWSHYNKLGRHLECFCQVEPVCERI